MWIVTNEKIVFFIVILIFFVVFTLSWFDVFGLIANDWRRRRKERQEIERKAKILELTAEKHGCKTIRRKIRKVKDGYSIKLYLYDEELQRDLKVTISYVNPKMEGKSENE